MISESFSHYAARDALNQSKLKKMLLSPAHLKHGIDEETEAKRLGSLAHIAVFEPEKLKELHIKPEGMKFSTKEGIAWRAAHPHNVVTQDDFTAAVSMRQAVMEHRHASMLLGQKGQSELTVLATDPEMQVPLKARLDWLSIEGKFILDLKTTLCAKPDIFMRDVIKYNYHLQSAWYQDIARLNGLEIDCFAFLVVEKEPPYAVSVCQLSAGSIEQGRQLYRRLLRRYVECLEKDEWPGYEDKVNVIELPGWVGAEREEMEGYTL